MSYSGAMWLAVQEDLYRGSCGRPTAEGPTKTHPPSSSPGSTSVASSRVHILDDYFLEQCFHLTRPCLIFILDYIKIRMKQDVFRSSNESVSSEAMILATLYFYTHGFLPRKITDMLGMEQTAAGDAINIVSKVLADMCPNFITFPSGYDDRIGVAQGFQLISDIPNVVGLLSSLHVKVSPSRDERSLFLNTRGYYSVMVQIISDVDGNLLSVGQCYPGGTQEQKVWESSTIFQEFNTLKHGQTWLIGNRALRKSKHVLTAVEGSNCKTKAARRFNMAHSQVLSSNQRILGSLKTRFQCLHNLGAVKANALKSVACVITACCVLHNISKKFSVPLPSELVYEPDHPAPVVGQDSDKIHMEETIEDMIEMCFGSPGDEDEQEAGKNTENPHTK